MKSGESGFSFSRKIPSNFYKETLIPILEEKIKDNEGIFVICRSGVADISFAQFIEELDDIFKRYKSIKKEILKNRKYCDGLAKRAALDKYDVERFQVIQEEGIFERLGLWDKIDELCQKIFMPNGSI